jgi:hypothetical protein
MSAEEEGRELSQEEATRLEAVKELSKRMDQVLSGSAPASTLVRFANRIDW